MPSPVVDLLLEDLVITDAGIETVLIFHRGVDLPAFAAFPLVESDEGRDHLAEYVADFVALADAYDEPLILETPTWRANADWGAQLGYSTDDLRRVAHTAVELAEGTRASRPGPGRTVISGSVGPRGDGYVPGDTMEATRAAAYHSQQISDLADAGADLVTSFTFSYVEEGTGFATAAAERGIPAVVGFTVETDGRLATGMPLGEAIETVDAATGSSVAWYMINCAHPDHVAAGMTDADTSWAGRVGALRANASRQSHAELDEAEELDEGNPGEFGPDAVSLRQSFGNLRVMGGCCGTDIRHVTAAAEAWTR